ncbi:helix-turn-helix domain-containing protein [Metabacillus bambusae]|uniref:AraC family transcriptional regulator n=1 Tax=Metabacillus bambusae TaxID=2795218 RepID=A0ABS3N206_9BACI|nr:helix-turn-helix domain-containing protein [Metabacillus bambusae]MBO1512124.1 AraC family transcriptional regulator [Metabacillus bambusae]
MLIASIPGLITGVLIYWIAVGAVEDELRKLHGDQIEQRAKNIDEQFRNLEYSASRWAIEPQFGESLRNIDLVKQFTESYDISKTLVRLQGTHPLIKDVDLYIEGEKKILFNTEYQLLNEQEISKFHKTLEGRNIYWGHYPGKDQNESSLALIHTIPAASKHPFGSIIITIHRDKALDLLKTLTPYGKGATFILNRDNEVILSANNTNDQSFVSALKNKLTNHDDNKESFQFTFDNQIYSVSLGHLSRVDSDWKYVSAAPMSSITEPLVIVSRIILIISASALILAIIMSWFASYRIYTPIRNLMCKLMNETTEKWKPTGKDEFLLIEQQWEELSQRSHLLQNRLSEQVTEIKNSFVVQLVQGYFSHYKEEDLVKRMKSYGWVVENHQYIALDVKLTGLFESKDRFSNNDESLVTFLTANIMEELAGEIFEQYNVIKFSDLSVGVLVVYPSGTMINEDIQRFANKVIDAVNEIINLQVIVSISESTNSIKKVHYLFEEMDKWKRLRIFENKNQIIDLQEMGSLKDINSFRYPFAVEKEIIQAIRMGQIEEIEKLIHQFIEGIAENGRNEINIQQGVRQLYSSIQHEILHAGIHPHDLYNGKDMFEELAQVHTIERFTKWFIESIILPFNQRLEGRMNMELKRIVEKVVLLIQENYMNDISLDSCAEEAGTNPYSLSKAFKLIVGINFIDYLTDIRIQKAKELLLHSTMKINDIAEAVGYRHSYFNRIFKKQMGIPPSQYRKLHQEKELLEIEKDS